MSDMVTSLCPSPQRLANLLSDLGDDSEHAPILEHLESCVACQHVFEKLALETADWSIWAGRLRDPRLEWPTTCGSDRAVAAPPTCPAIPGYEALEYVGAGGMGVVYRAHQVALGRWVALKIIRQQRQGDADCQRRFRQEAMLAAKLRHSNLVQVFDAGVAGDSVYLTFEYIAGGTLADHLHTRVLSDREAAALVEVLAHAVAAAHTAGVVHRDLKPANILLAPCERNGPPGVGAVHLDGKPCVPKVADFGLARDQGQVQVTGTNVVMGTPSYMAPEQARTAPNWSTPAVDVYGLGTILYEALTGRPPFRGPTTLETLRLVAESDPARPRSLQPRVPMDLETICLKCLRKEPAARYASALDLAADLRRFLDGKPIKARPVSAARHAWAWARRHPALALLALACTALLLGCLVLGAVYTIHLHHKNNELADLNRQLQAQARVVEAQEQENAAQSRHLREQRAKLDEVLAGMAASLWVFSEAIRTDPRFLAASKDNFRHRIVTATLAAQQRLVDLMADRPELAPARARALYSISGMHHALGQSRQAVEQAGQALALWDQASRTSSSPQQQLDAANCQFHLANLLERSQRTTEAKQAFTKTIAMLERIAPEDPAQTDEVQGTLGHAHNQLATKLLAKSAESWPQAAQHVAAARKALDQVKGEQHRVRVRIAQANSDILDGMLAERRGEASAAGHFYQAAFDALAEVYQREPDSLNTLQRLAWSARQLALWRRNHGPPEQAIADLNQARDFWGQLASAQPQTAHHFELAGLDGLRGEMYVKAGSVELAAAAFRSALAEGRRAARAQPPVWSYVRLFGELCVTTHRQHRLLGISAAEIPCAEAAELVKPYTQGGPEANYARKLFSALQNTGLPAVPRPDR